MKASGGSTQICQLYRRALTMLTQRFSTKPNLFFGTGSREEDKRVDAERSRGPSLTTASRLINAVQGCIMSGISRANLTDESGREYASAFSTSVKFVISVRECWRLAQQWLNRPARPPVFLVARSDLESPITPRVGVSGLGGRKPRGFPCNSPAWNLCVRTCLCFKS